MKKYIVKLTDEERSDLEQMIATGKKSACKLAHARILLKADESENGPGWKDEQISEAVETSLSTIFRVRQRFVEEGIEAALSRKPGSGIRERKVDGDCEAHLVALTCSTPPEGHGRWTLRLLADKMVELEYIDEISYETVRQVLKKNELKPWQKKQWCIPPESDAEFVCNMEDVLEVYKRPYDEASPVICMDEACKQLVKETRIPLPMRPGDGECYDYEYERAGTRNMFMACEPLKGKRYVKVTEHRTRQDWAEFIREIVDQHYPEARKVVLVMDNLNTHAPSSFYATFEPEEARHLIERLEIHSTPKHGSWLNMAEIELSVLAGQCLDRRIGSEEDLMREISAWQEKRNNKEVQVNWHFTTQDARIKLKHLYPSLSH
jgi:transposase